MALAGKIAIVTGGARGIGYGIVVALAAQGAKVAFNYLSESSASAAEALVEKVRALNNGSEAIAIRCDISTPDAPKTIVSEVLSKFNTTELDILVNNAGVSGPVLTLDQITLETYDQVVNTNLRAVIFLTQAVLPHMRRGGRIINLSSILARKAQPGGAIYSATKAGLEALTRVWAAELGQKYGVTVNAINPGPVDTDMYRNIPDDFRGVIDEMAKMTPAAARVATVEDIADIVALLCEERSRWISGDVVCANGGMVMV